MAYMILCGQPLEPALLSQNSLPTMRVPKYGFSSSSSVRSLFRLRISELACLIPLTARA